MANLRNFACLINSSASRRAASWRSLDPTALVEELWRRPAPDAFPGDDMARNILGYKAALEYKVRQ